MIINVTQKHIQQGMRGGCWVFGKGVPGCMLQEAIRDATGWPHVGVNGYQFGGYKMHPVVAFYPENPITDMKGYWDYHEDKWKEVEQYSFYRSYWESYVILPDAVKYLYMQHDKEEPGQRTIKPFSFELLCEEILAELREKYPEEFIAVPDLKNIVKTSYESSS